jgi:hypothetical protein
MAIEPATQAHHIPNLRWITKTCKATLQSSLGRYNLQRYALGNGGDLNDPRLSVMALGAGLP